MLSLLCLPSTLEDKPTWLGVRAISLLRLLYTYSEVVQAGLTFLPYPESTFS